MNPVPRTIIFALIAAVLFSACIVYGRMSASNEIIAVKSIGISPSAVVIPGLIMAFVLSLTTLYLNDVAVSWGRSGIYRAILNSSA